MNLTQCHDKTAAENGIHNLPYNGVHGRKNCTQNINDSVIGILTNTEWTIICPQMLVKTKHVCVILFLTVAAIQCFVLTFSTWIYRYLERHSIFSIPLSNCTRHWYIYVVTWNSSPRWEMITCGVHMSIIPLTKHRHNWLDILSKPHQPWPFPRVQHDNYMCRIRPRVMKGEI